MSSYSGQDLFGSGPHRTYLGRRGQLLTIDFFGGESGGGSTAQGLMDWDIVIRGRLIASGDAGLTTLRNAILAQLQDPPVLATLIDTQGRTWNDMSLVTFSDRGRRDRGRQFSIRYEAVFRKF